MVLDSSAIIEALVKPEVAVRLASAIGDAVAIAPEVVDVEVLSGLRRGVGRGHPTERGARVAIERFLASPLERLPHRAFLRDAWKLRHNVTAADALYVAVARAFQATLITTDARLAGAPGLGVPVTVLPS